MDMRSVTHVRCRNCAVFVLKEANVCNDCGAKLVPRLKVGAATEVDSVAQAAAAGDGGGFFERFLRSEVRSRAKLALRVKRAARLS